MTCEECLENVVESLTGDRPTPRADAAAHLASCNACRDAAHAYGALHARLQSAAQLARSDAQLPSSAAMQIVNDALARSGRHLTRRRFMHRVLHSPTVRFSTAAMIIAAIALIWLNFPRHGAGVAFAEVIRNTRQAKTLSFKLTTNANDGPITEFQYSVKDDRFSRFESSEGTIVIADLEARRGLILNPRTRSAASFVPGFGQAGIYDQLRAVPDTGELFGEEQVDGRRTLIFRTTLHDAEVRLLADAQSRLPIRIDLPSLHEHPAGQIRDIVFDAPLDDSLFSLDPPPDYTVGPVLPDPHVHMIIMSTMRNIVTACVTYEQEHGAWPPAIDQLDRYGVTAEMLRDPADPVRVQGFVYMQPTEPIAGSEVVLYEHFDTWQRAICVAFADGHVETIASQADFEARLAGGAKRD